MADNTPNLITSLEGLLAGLQVAVEAAAPTPVPMPELGGSVYVRGPDTAEWLDPENTGMAADASERHKRGWNVARYVCSADGARLVKPTDTTAIELFAALPWAASHRILVAAGVMDGAERKND